MYTPRGVGMVRGLGASCPSYQQLNGIDDVNDPCQVAAGLTASGNTIVGPAVLTPTPAVVQAIAAGQNVLAPPAAPGPFSGVMTWLSQNTMLAIGLGIGLILLMPGGRRR